MAEDTDDARPTLLLLDGHSLAYRAFYALPDSLRTRTGDLTNAVYGFTSMLIRLLADEQPEGIAVAFDAGRDVARTEAYPEYKAQREETPDEFRPQLDLIKQVLEVLEIPILSVSGVEADDVIATVADVAADEGYRVRVVTGDRDAMQLVRDEVTVLYTLRGITEMAEMTPDAVEERYGVRPGAYVDYAALRGDTSDNLPGVPGVGEKTAAKLLDRFGDVPGVYDNLEDVGGTKRPTNLAEHREQVELNRRLMRLRHDVDVDVDPGELQMGTFDADAVRRLFGTLEFRALYDRFVEDVLGEHEQEVAEALEPTPVRLEPGALADWLADAEPPVAVLPVTGGRVPHLRLDGVALACASGPPVAGDADRLEPADLQALARLLADPDRPVVTHDGKMLHHVAHDRRWELAGIAVDTELAAYLLNPEQRSFDLDQIALQHLNRTISTEDADEDDQLQLDVAEEAWRDRALRAEAARQLADHLTGELAARGQRELLDTIELPLMAILADMERAGIAVDRSVLDEIRERLAARAEELEAEIHDHAGHRFNVGSGPQLQEVLFEELELTRTKRIKTGWSTAADQLQGIIDEHPIVAAVLEWREVTKLLSTYVDALPPLVDETTGRIHTTLSQTTAATGRLSSSDPNLQNVPVRRPEGREIRRAFVAGDGYDHLLVADYGQIELRVMAHLSRDEGLLEAFARGEDIHATTAAEVFDVPVDQVDATLRDRAKAVNYGLAYGLTPYGLSQQLAIPPDEAEDIVDAYMERFPKVSEYLERAVEDARRDGYTTTLFGRRRYLPDLVSGNYNRRRMAERMALNAPIQGTAADIIKLAMIRVSDALGAEELDSRMLLQVHDEIILEVTDDHLDVTEDLVVEAMRSVADLAVPLVVDTAVGATWLDAQKH